MKIKVLLLGKKEACTQVQLALRDEDISVAGSVSDENRVLDEISRTQPNLILVTEASPMALRACHQIYLLRPRCVPVMIADPGDHETAQKAMQAGIHYILPPGMDPIGFMTELKSIASNESNRIAAMENAGTSSNKSKVILVFGVKDGIGKSTLAVNLAVKLAEKKNKVVLLDYDLQFGDVATLLGQEPKNTILELIQEQSNPNADVIRQFLTLHVSGVSFLPAPHSPEYANMITAVQAERIVSALRVYYDYVLIDAASGFDDISAACIDCASIVLFVTGRDIPSIRNTKKGLSVLQALASTEKIRLVVGRCSETAGREIREEDISRVLEIPVWRTIPYDERSAVGAANQGIPLVLENGKSKICRAIAGMADDINQQWEKAPPAAGERPAKFRFGREKRR
jgi:pilus assembly protein CpaE